MIASLYAGTVSVAMSEVQERWKGRDGMVMGRNVNDAIDRR